MMPNCQHGLCKSLTLLAASALLGLGHPAQALDIALPEGAVVVAAASSEQGSHVVATGPWDGTHVPTRDVTGLTRTGIWQIPGTSDASLVEVANAIETQLRDQGYRIDLTCRENTCGGFDFRRSLDMGRSPDMHVDIGNFRYVSATPEDGEGAAAVTISRGGDTIYVHVAHIGAALEDSPWVTSSSRAPGDIDAPAPTRDIATTAEAILNLTDIGAVPLDDLYFETGASELSGRDYPSLVALAEFLATKPSRRVVLVGHTDAEGGRDSNIALSEARADAVRRHLIDQMDVNPAQLDSAGIGYLAPRATNETAGGREANRRVEVVLLSGD